MSDKQTSIPPWLPMSEFEAARNLAKYSEGLMRMIEVGISNPPIYRLYVATLKVHANELTGQVLEVPTRTAERAQEEEGC